MLGGCEQELCFNWAGDGCVCSVFGIEPEVPCKICKNPASPEDGLCELCRELNS